MFTFDFANFWNNFRFLCRLWSLRNQHSTVPITTTVKHPCTCTGGVMTQGHVAATCCSHKIMCCSHKGDMFVCMQCDSVMATCVPATRPCYMSPTCEKHTILPLQHVLATCSSCARSLERYYSIFLRLAIWNFSETVFRDQIILLQDLCLPTFKVLDSP